ncbi:MAG: putative dehydrogenase [Marivirga sp.]|jgi:predicted dehydrogenase
MGKQIKIGIIGTGKIAAQMAEAIKLVPDATPYAIGSRRIESANNFAQKHHFNKAYGSYESMLCDEQIDLVYVATPHNLHFENTMLALDHGKHVLCEKPFGVNSNEVEQMIASAKEKKLFLMEAMWSRFMPHIQQIKALINQGEIGPIKLLRSDFNMYPPFNAESRLFNKSLIGGSLMDIGIYPVFLALYILGQPKRIQAMAGIGAAGVDYQVAMSFEYDNEIMAMLSSSMVSRGGINASIEGEKGSIILENPWHIPSNFTVKYGDGSTKKFEYKHTGNGYHYELQEVINCLNAGKVQSDKMSWGDSLELIEVLDEIRKKAGIFYPEHDNK